MDLFLKKHQNQEDVQKLLIFRDIEHWREELLVIKEEVSFFKTLLKKQKHSEKRLRQRRMNTRHWQLQ